MSNVTDSPIESAPGQAAATPDLGQTIKTGAGWTIAARFGGRIVRFLTFFLLAKLLGPNLIGVVGVIYMIDPIGMIVTRLGLSAAIVQKKNVNADHFDTAMVISVCAGLVFAGLVAALAPVAGRLLEDELLGQILPWYSFVFVARAFSYIPAAVLRRKMAFRTFALLGECANIAGCLVMLGVAFGGLGVWSVLWAELTRAALLSGLSIGLAGHRFRPRFHIKAAREMAGFSGWVTVTGVFYYGLCNIDKILIRVVLGRTALGLYVFAFRLISQPLEQIAMRLYEVMFPAFSRFQDQPDEVLRVYRKLTCAISLFALPLLSIAVVLAEDFFAVVMGPKWAGAVLPFQILCVAGMIRAFVGSSSALLKSRGYVRFEGMALAALFALMATGVGTALLIHRSLPGVAVAVDLVIAAYLGSYLVYQGRKTNVTVRVFVDAVLPVIHCTLIAVVVCLGVTWLLTAAVDVGELARLLIAGSAAVVAFVLAVMVHRNSTIRSVKWELKRLVRRPKTDA